MTSFMPNCPVCKCFYRQIKAGMAVNGNQRYQCQDCKRTYVQENRRYRYPLHLRARAVELHNNGKAYREIARILDVNHQTVANWIKSMRMQELLELKDCKLPPETCHSSPISKDAPASD